MFTQDPIFAVLMVMLAIGALIALAYFLSAAASYYRHRRITAEVEELRGRE